MATTPHSCLTAAMICRLMRKHHITIQTLSERFQITKKRIREVRARGVTGFLASEWHYMITGVWLDGSAI